jgi:hypothetical protein
MAKSKPKPKDPPPPQKKKSNMELLTSDTTTFIIRICIYFILGVKLVYMKESIQHLDYTYQITPYIKRLNTSGAFTDAPSYTDVFNNSLLIFKNSSNDYNIYGVNITTDPINGNPIITGNKDTGPFMDFIALTQLTYLKILQYILITLDTPFLIMLLSPFIVIGTAIVSIVYYVYLCCTYSKYTYWSCWIFLFLFFAFIYISPFIGVYTLLIYPSKDDIKPLDLNGNPFHAFGLNYIRDLMSRSYFKYVIVILINLHIIKMCTSYTSLNIIMVIAVLIGTFLYSFKIQDLYKPTTTIELNSKNIYEFKNAVDKILGKINETKTEEAEKTEIFNEFLEDT